MVVLASIGVDETDFEDRMTRMWTSDNREIFQLEYQT